MRVQASEARQAVTGADAGWWHRAPCWFLLILAISTPSPGRAADTEQQSCVVDVGENGACLYGNWLSGPVELRREGCTVWLGGLPVYPGLDHGLQPERSGDCADFELQRALSAFDGLQRIFANSRLYMVGRGLTQNIARNTRYSESFLLEIEEAKARTEPITDENWGPPRVLLAEMAELVRQPIPVESCGLGPGGAGDRVGIIHPREIARLSLDTETVVIGEPIDIAIASADTCLVLDFQQQLLFVFTAESGFVRTIGRRGEGPGETLRASRILTGARHEIGLVDMLPPRVHWFDATGTPKGSVELRLHGQASGLTTAFDVTYVNKSYVACLYDLTPRNRGLPPEYAVASFDHQGDLTHRLMSDTDDREPNPRIADERDGYHFAFDPWAADTSGRVYFAPERDSYRIDVVDTAGIRKTLVEGRLERRSRTDAERAEMIHRYRSGSPGNRTRKYLVADHDAFVSKMFFVPTPDGEELWIQTTVRIEDAPAGTFAVYDIYSLGGEHLRRLMLVGDVDLRFDLWEYDGGETGIALRNCFDSGLASGDEDSGRHRDPEMELVFYRVR